MSIFFSSLYFLSWVFFLPSLLQQNVIPRLQPPPPTPAIRNLKKVFPFIYLNSIQSIMLLILLLNFLLNSICVFGENIIHKHTHTHSRAFSWGKTLLYDCLLCWGRSRAGDRMKSISLIKPLNTTLISYFPFTRTNFPK